MAEELNDGGRVAYLEARVGELNNTIGELRAESENRLQVGDRLGWRLVEARQEIERLRSENNRLRREVEFEAHVIDPGREGGYFRDNIRFPLCSCFSVHPEGGTA